MENASKALLIGAAILMAVMILSLLMIGYQQISSYFAEKHEVAMIEQTTKFNSQFENYNQKDIRGSDMISLMNKVIDSNERLSYMEGTNYKRIEITIDLKNTVKQFEYSTTDSGFSNVSIFPSNGKITNVTTTGDPPNTVEESRRLDKQLMQITGTVNELTNEDENGGIPNVTDTKLQSLASNISNIFLSIANLDDPSTKIDENYAVNIDETKRTSTEENIVNTRQKRNDLIKNTLGINITLNSNGTVKEKTLLESIKKMTWKYYQITQFKRAHFECVSTEYDTETGRILKMNFRVKTTDGNTVVFN